MTDKLPTVIRARSHEGMLAAIPYLLTFHPENSLVLVFLDDQQVVLTGRLDLPETEELPDMGGWLTEVALIAGATALSAVTYHPDVSLGLAALARIERESPLPVSELIHASEDYFWAACCDDPLVPRPYDVVSHEVSASAVLAGVSALPDRAAVQRLASGPTPAVRDACVAAFALAAQTVRDLDPHQRLELTVKLVEHHLLDPAGMDVPTCALLATLILEIPSRDAAWLMMSRPSAGEHLALWSRVVAHTIAPWEMAPLCLLGSAAWINGNGALLVECIERGEQIDPHYSLLHILNDINLRALPPTAWDEIFALDLRESLLAESPGVPDPREEAA